MFQSCEHKKSRTRHTGKRWVLSDITVPEGPRVLAVVGMGHVDGIMKYYGKMKQEDIVPLLL